MSKSQVFVAKSDKLSNPWYNNIWKEKDKVAKADKFVIDQVTCKDVTDMRWMFQNCSDLISLDLSNFDTSKVEDMHSMFEDCSNLTSLDVSNFNTSNVKDMTLMFYGCSSLTSLDLSSFDTSNTTEMIKMFESCSKLISVDLSNFDTSNVTDIWEMFANCTCLTSIKGIIDMKSCTQYDDMFYGCFNLKDVKIKNPPADTDWWEKAGFRSESQFTVVS